MYVRFVLVSNLFLSSWPSYSTTQHLTQNQLISIFVSDYWRLKRRKKEFIHFSFFRNHVFFFVVWFHAFAIPFRTSSASAGRRTHNKKENANEIIFQYHLENFQKQSSLWFDSVIVVVVIFYRRFLRLLLLVVLSNVYLELSMFVDDSRFQNIFSWT